MQQGGSMDELHHRRQRIQAVVIATQRPTGQNGNHRPQPLAARTDNISTDLGNQSHFRLHRPIDNHIDTA